MPTSVENIRTEFFELIFGDEEGQLCIATSHKIRGKDSFRRFFFRYPHNVSDALQFIEQKAKHHNVWFATSLFDRSEAKKTYARRSRIVWADLDTCNPEVVSPQPPIVIQSSPGHWQAIWLLDNYVPPEIAEEYSKRIAYKYEEKGADTSGWDIGQLLRVPDTYNMKSEYQSVGGDYPLVTVERMLDLPMPVTIFEGIEATYNGNAPGSLLNIEIPTNLPEPQAVIERFSPHIDDMPRFVSRFEEVPDASDDWSSLMWNLINMCLESGMDEKETFAVVSAAACNKYKRDARPERYLWLEVLKAKNRFVRIGDFKAPETTFVMPTIYDGDKDDEFTFIDNYREYGYKATDAPTQFHDLSAFILLSSILSANLKLDTTYGTIRPNLWGLILGESTLTRKTTAMRMAMEVVAAVDEHLLLTTEGSIEGIITAMAARNGKVSIFFRDEVSGFFEQTAKKDYLSGMQEVFTHLYDVPRVYRRTLRKEVISVHNPLFIFYGGGIREQTYFTLRERAVTSGFLPRFLIVAGDTQLDRVRPLGPPVAGEDNGQLEIVQTAAYLYNEYHRTASVKIAGTSDAIEDPIITDCQLTPEAWEKYGQIDRTMLEVAHGSPLADLALPTFQRLTTSMLKMAMLIAASRQEPRDNQITVERRDVISASKYVQQWGNYSIDMILNVGKGISERELSRSLRSIQKHPGIQRSYFMRVNHLDARTTTDLIETLLQRGHIRIEGKGKAQHYFAIED